MDKKKSDLIYKISFRCIKIMHDGILIRLLVNPARVLTTLGLKRGDTVFEPGCGPGFFTVGAVQVVGDKGHVYSYDINPYAIQYLQKKLVRNDLQNVTTEERNAADTNLPGESVDFAFITGIPRAIGGFDKLMNEISRILKPGGLFAYRSHNKGKNGFTAKELESWQFVPVPEKNSNKFKIFKKL